MLRPSQIKQLFIHCAATPNGSTKYTAPDIDYWHELRGFRRAPDSVRSHQPLLPHIGYHDVIHVDGARVPGRSLAEVGAHARGHNADSIGVCLLGEDKFTAAQWRALHALVERYLRELGRLAVRGHREVNPDKSCPGFDVSKWLDGGMEPLQHHLWRTEQ